MIARFGTYNLLEGGIDRDGSEHRRLSQIAILEPLGIDVLSLSEVKGLDKDDWRRLYELTDALKMITLGLARSQRHNGDGSPNYTALLVRPDTVQIKSCNPRMGTGAFHHGAIRALLCVKGVDYRVFATHLSWTDGATRLAESRWFTDYAKGSTVTMGDFNEDSPTAPQPDWSKIPQQLHSRYRLVNHDGSYGDADRRAMGNLLSAGYVDPCAYLGQKAEPTTGHYYENEKAPQTLDHILVGDAAKKRIRRYWSPKDKVTQKASDHLPKLLDLSHACGNSH
ncbi:endonuclease/exonuclease/phosphatase family protein [Streptomyces sp. 110]|uniref:Endonuclease/exonuclease/phosphatase family protein n=1 Tax=Streptomyces endocoffeicus TaxID=2898945 RepID=A0ABS1PS66_9ACTN|nr:endonuclease/exonuclease/phosphatase family protein [Streptomyces endocoffeicus]MBL1115280.1 endonuclease/exonuclease/phosphatase family protein [Streptomyces endocoffeicus]